MHGVNTGTGKDFGATSSPRLSLGTDRARLTDPVEVSGRRGHGCDLYSQLPSPTAFAHHAVRL